jgi:hypothetical protein
MTRLLVKCAVLAMLAGVLVLGTKRLWAHEDHDGDADDGASRNMKLVGFNDLQARSTYQPTLHKQGGRYYIYAGHHAYGPPGEGSAPAGTPPLPKVNNEENGTSIVDVTNPRHPKYVHHIPVPNGSGGGAQMVRVCDGSTLPIHDSKVYMLRTYANSAHEIWDVTDPSNPVGVRTVAGGNPVIGAQTGRPGRWRGRTRTGGSATRASPTSSAGAAMTRRQGGRVATISSSSTSATRRTLSSSGTGRSTASSQAA